MDNLLSAAKAARKEAKLTQAQIATTLGISLQRVKEIEGGNTISFDLFERWIKACEHTYNLTITKNEQPN